MYPGCYSSTRSWLVNERFSEECSSPICGIAIVRAALLTAVHGQKVVHGAGREIVRDFFREVVREEIDKLVCDLKQTLVHAHSHRCGSK